MTDLNNHTRFELAKSPYYSFTTPDNIYEPDVGEENQDVIKIVPKSSKNGYFITKNDQKSR